MSGLRPASGPAGVIQIPHRREDEALCDVIDAGAAVQVGQQPSPGA